MSVVPDWNFMTLCEPCGCFGETLDIEVVFFNSADPDNSLIKIGALQLLLFCDEISNDSGNNIPKDVLVAARGGLKFKLP